MTPEEARALFGPLNDRLQQLCLTDEGGESEEAEAIRDRMDEPWQAMTRAMQDEFRSPGREGRLVSGGPDE